MLLVVSLELAVALSVSVALQASKDCVQKTLKRLEDKIVGRVLNLLLYMMHSAQVHIGPVIVYPAHCSLARSS